MYDHTITCDCGKRWTIYKRSVPMRDKDSIECDCGKTLLRWNGGVMYTAELKK